MIPASFSRRSCLAGVAVIAATRAAPGFTLLVETSAPIRASLNENAFGPSPRVAEAIRKGANKLDRYVDQGEVDALARQIGALEGVPPGQIVIGELLDALGLFLARQKPGGGRIVYSNPGYTALVDAAAPLGGAGVPIPLDARLQNDLPALAAAIDERTLAVSLVNPHNPSGTVSDADAWHGFLRAVARRTLVIVDEAYLEYDDFARLGAVRHVRDGANVLVFRTLTKIYGLGGMSIGYAVAPAHLAESLKRAGIGAPHSFSRLSLVAAGAALADQEHVAWVKAETARERGRLTAALDRKRLTHSDSRANFVFFRPSRPAADVRAAFAQAGIEVARPFPPLAEWIRITVGLPAENDRIIRAILTSA